MNKDYAKKFLLDLYEKMLTIRLCEESLVSPILHRDICCPCHLCSGQEATAVGVCSALEQEDYVFGNHRSHGHFLAKGGDFRSMIAEIYGKMKGCSGGRGGSMHLIDPEAGFMGSAPIVAGTISLAVGSALASKIRKEQNVSVCFFGDGASNEGVLFESLNFASLKKLPIVFVCENNLYSTHMPILECRPNNDICRIAEPFDIECVQIDGNDVLEVYKTAQKAVDICRSGGGPYFIEALTYRLRGHVGPDDNIQGDHTDIRPEAEIEHWKSKDPVKKMEKYLISRSIIDRISLTKIESEIKKQIEEAHLNAAACVYSKEENAETYVFKS